MQYSCHVVVALAIFVFLGTSSEVSAMMPRGPPPMKPPANAPEKAHNFKIVLRKVEYEALNGEFLGDESFGKVEMYNDSMPVYNMNVIVIKDLPPNLMIEVSGFNLQASNQWVPIFDQGVHNYCEYAETNVSFMKPFLAVSNFTECPVKKGVYTVKNMVVDEKGFPPQTPEGLFKIVLVFTQKRKQFLRLAFYADVEQKEDDDH